MRFRQSLMKYSEKYGVSKASRKYNKSRSYIYFWKNRWDGSVESLAEKSKRPHHHPNEHTEEEITMIRNFRRRNPDLDVAELWHRLKKKGYTRRLESLYRVMKKLKLGVCNAFPRNHLNVYLNAFSRMDHLLIGPGNVLFLFGLRWKQSKLYQYTAIDEYSRTRFLYGYEEQSTYSSADFAKRLVKWYKRQGITVECIQTDNGFEFTNRFSPSMKDKKTLFENTLEQLGVKHKLIRPYTPRHNGKVERSHREDHNKFYSCHSFYCAAKMQP